MKTLNSVIFSLFAFCVIASIGHGAEIVIFQNPTDPHPDILTASVVTTTPTGVTVVTEDGTHQELAAASVLTRIPIPVEGDSPTAFEQLNLQLSACQKALTQYPTLSDKLTPFLTSWGKMEQKFAEDPNDAAKTPEQRLTDLFAVKYEPEKDYEIKFLISHIAKGQVLIAALPSEATSINTHLEPWVKELQQMNLGLIKRGAQWVSKSDPLPPPPAPPTLPPPPKPTADVPHQDVESYEDTSFNVEPVLVSSLETICLLAGAAISCLFLIYAILQGWSRTSERGFNFFGIISLGFGMGILILYAFATHCIFTLPANHVFIKPDLTGSKRVVLDEMACYATGNLKFSNNVATVNTVTIPTRILNQYLLRSINWKYPPEGPDGWTLSRSNIHIHFTDDRIKIFEDCQIMGSAVVVVHNIYYTRLSNGAYEFSNWRVSLGTLKLPENIASRFRDRLLADFEPVCHGLGIPDKFNLLEVSKDGLTFVKVGARISILPAPQAVPPSAPVTEPAPPPTPITTTPASTPAPEAAPTVQQPATPPATPAPAAPPSTPPAPAPTPTPTS